VKGTFVQGCATRVGVRAARGLAILCYGALLVVLEITLVSHMHGDHAGNAHNKEPNSGSCATPDVSVSALPNSSAVNIALAKKAKIRSAGRQWSSTATANAAPGAELD
jgi:glyoxylase-like metal-dependent hydrolase (beta-lactamase superfamily II)